MRMVDADALMEYCNNLKDKTIDANDIARFPTAVLKEQEPVAPRYKDPYHAYCGACGCRIPLKIKARYCHKCGRKVKWNDA